MRSSRANSPLRQELENLEKNLRKTELFMQDAERDFWTNGGTCCPGCGIYWWRPLEDKQVRRRERVKQILIKLERDGRKPENE